MVIESELTNLSKKDPRPAWKQLQVGDSGDEIVLINPDLGPTDQPFHNLLRRRKDNSVVWRAEFPKFRGGKKPDSYVEVRWDGSNLAANTWSGWYVLIDPETGKLGNKEFVK